MSWLGFDLRHTQIVEMSVCGWVHGAQQRYQPDEASCRVCGHLQDRKSVV